MHAPLALTRPSAKVAAIAILALVLGFALAIAGLGRAQASPGDGTTDPFCADGAGPALDVTVTLDPAIYGTHVPVVAEVHEEDDATGEEFIYVVNGVTDDRGVATLTFWTPEDVSTGWEIYYYDAEADEYRVVDGQVSSARHECSPPVTEVCVLAIRPGSATVRYGDVIRTVRFSTRISLPERCVTAAEAKAWAERLGLTLR
jgi:hypothetical protein